MPRRVAVSYPDSTHKTIEEATSTVRTVIVIVIVIGGLKSMGLTTIIKWVRKRYLDEDIPTIRGLSTLRGTQLP
jgi:hypothetical protein